MGSYRLHSHPQGLILCPCRSQTGWRPGRRCPPRPACTASRSCRPRTPRAVTASPATASGAAVPTGALIASGARRRMTWRTSAATLEARRRRSRPHSTACGWPSSVCCRNARAGISPSARCAARCWGSSRPYPPPTPRARRAGCAGVGLPRHAACGQAVHRRPHPVTRRAGPAAAVHTGRLGGERH